MFLVQCILGRSTLCITACPPSLIPALGCPIPNCIQDPISQPRTICASRTGHRAPAVCQGCRGMPQSGSGTGESFLTRPLPRAHRLGQPLLTKIAERSRKSYAHWRTSADDAAAMDIDQGDTPKVVSFGAIDGNSPFSTVHPDLTRCLQDFDKRPPPCLHALSTFVPQSRPAHSEPETRPDPVSAHDLSTDMLALALGRNGDLTSVRHALSDSATSGIGSQRVGNHTFNFDFGALASNVENQSNTYMSWF